MVIILLPYMLGHLNMVLRHCSTLTFSERSRCVQLRHVNSAANESEDATEVIRVRSAKRAISLVNIAIPHLRRLTRTWTRLSPC
jgi:hypothetical protein